MQLDSEQPPLPLPVAIAGPGPAGERRRPGRPAPYRDRGSGSVSSVTDAPTDRTRPDAARQGQEGAEVFGNLKLLPVRPARDDSAAASTSANQVLISCLHYINLVI